MDDRAFTMFWDSVKILVAVALAWTVGARVAYVWDDRRRRRESDLAAVHDFYRAYGQFFTTWKLWDTHKQKVERGYVVNPPPTIQWQLLEKAEEAEGEFESLLLKIASERKLGERQRSLISAFRQGYQSLREEIRVDKALAWWLTEQQGMPERKEGFREYRAFKALAEYVAYELVMPSDAADRKKASAAPTPTWRRALSMARAAVWPRIVDRPTQSESIEAFLTIIKRDYEWVEAAETEFKLPPTET